MPLYPVDFFVCYAACIQYTCNNLFLFQQGNCGENTAKNLNIGREEQDEYALSSYKKSQAAAAAGIFKKEITPVSIPKKGGKSRIPLEYTVNVDIFALYTFSPIARF